ncbi:MAG TPA: hypothetical protein VFW87_06670 [Pirellulales bacterium]|nr:hypothetical protein [Pirellulales bacterium]
MSISPVDRLRRVRWRRWFALAGVLSLAAFLACGWWVQERLDRAAQQRAAVAAIRRLGGRVLYDDQFDATAEPASRWLRRWLGDDGVREVASVSLRGAWLPGPQLVNKADDSRRHAFVAATDDDLICLRSLVHLKHLDLRRTRVTDAGLRHLVGLDELEDLRLSNTAVTDRGLAYLAQLPHLRRLWLDDEEYEADCRGAESDHLRRYKPCISDAGLECLEQFKQLEFIDLTGCHPSDAARQKLAVALPGCEIRWTAGPIYLPDGPSGVPSPRPAPRPRPRQHLLRL